MKSIYLQKDKITFDLSQYPAEAFAASLGLPGAPQIKFGNQQVKEKKRGGKEDVEVVVQEAKMGRDVVASDDEDEDEDEDEKEDEDEETGDEEVSDEAEESESGPSESESETDDPVTVSLGLGVYDHAIACADLPLQSKAPAVRTKYDRMFERKNQSILAPHYSALISHENGDENENDDDVFTLARRDHEIEGVDNDDSALLEETPQATSTVAGGSASGADPLISAEDLSKRKLKAATSKKALLKSRPMADKLIFDEKTGEARNFYESGVDVENLAGDEESRRRFLEEEREKMREAHRIDKEVAREKKREKKRKRQERAARQGDSDGDSDDEGGAVAFIGGGEEFDDLPVDFSEAEAEEEVPRPKKTKKGVQASGNSLEDEEALALRLLQGN